MTIPPQLLMAALPMLMSGMSGQGNLMGAGQQPSLMGPLAQQLNLNPAFQIGPIPGLMGQLGAKSSPLFGLGPIPGLWDMMS